MSYPKSGSASRTVALDLMLRTFMNSADFQATNPKIWENIAKLVPGTTPQQCFHRWDELRASSHTVVGDFSGLTAQGRPISAHSQSQRRQMTKFVRSMLNPHTQRPSQSEAYPDSRPQSVLSNAPPERLRASMEREPYSRPLTANERNHVHTGKFVANFYQNMLSGGSSSRKEGGASPQELVETREDTDAGVAAAQPKVTRAACTEARDTVSDSEPSDSVDNGIQYGSSSSFGENGPNMVIHVCDEAKKLKRNFICPRDILIREMRYFAEYLSSDAQLWDEVDISVHCDVPVFDWLMRYAKQGMLEGACGENLSEPLPCPKLESGSAVSILISSDFLKMDKLVEQCLEFVHENISAVVASPCNMGCISDRLMARLAAKFTPLEIENVIDRKDKIKSKLFIYQLQQLFKPSLSTPDCPASAATLYRCKYCGRLLTVEQRTMLPCIAKRVSVDRNGSMVYSHERDTSWEVNQHLHSLQQEGLSAGDIYWRLWGVVNWLVCEHCRLPFQCCDLASCFHHPQSPVTVAASGARLASPCYPCCGRPALSFSALPHCQSGCAVRDHTIATSRPITASSRTDSASTAAVRGGKEATTRSTMYSMLLAMRDLVCRGRSQPQHADTSVVQDSPETSLLQNEETKLRVQFSSGQQLEPHLQPPGKTEREANTSTVVINDSISGHVHPSNSRQLLTQGAAMATRQQSHDTRHKSRDTRHQSHDVRHQEHDDGEEEEADSPPQLPAHSPRPRKNRHVHSHMYGASVKQRHLRHEQWPPPLMEWVWDSSKSKRWNQDMQRESDERRLTALSRQLSQISHKPPSSEGAPTKSNKEGSYAGGIYSRLETQFRANQAARAMALQSTYKSQGSGRRR